MSALRLDWRPSALALALALAVTVSLVVALATGRWQLVLFAAPMIGVLASARRRRPDSLGDQPQVQVVRCFEDEPVVVRLATLACADAVVSAEPRLCDPMSAKPGGDGPDRITVTAPRWGRYPVALDVHVDAADGLAVAAQAQVAAAVVQVFPLAPAELTDLPVTELPSRVGTHRTSRHGPGVEFAEVAEYRPGEPIRAVNWRVSARRGQLHVTRRFTDRSADVVVVLDRHAQASGPATDAADLVVRGATQVVSSALQGGDRVGVVTLGQRPRWLPPDLGRRQFYRILDVLLEVDDQVQAVSGTVVPGASLPRGAVMIAFSTLLDAEFALAMIDAHRRGSPVVVVDVLRETPFRDPLSPELNALWRMSRAGMYRDLRASGVQVSPWPADTPLAAVLAQRHAIRTQR